ncbi:MAG TPA: agmatinase [Bacillota bacterium]|nr:agmatinase [Fastidiosipila sp.]HPX93669.1 agmatinase [Bacillota bacterium]HQB81427.1 agmatinase [Bacillota bacterium]
MNESLAFEGRSFCGCDRPYEESQLVLFGAPYDSSTSFRPGARFGPSAMRRDSWGLETYSPALDRDLEESKVCDLGDLELPSGDAELALARVRALCRSIAGEEKIPVMIGGDHSLTFGAVGAASGCYPGLHLVQLDAHTDLRDHYLGSRWSHASVMRRCHELLGSGRIHSFGIRSGLREEFDYAREYGDLHPFSLEEIPSLFETVKDAPVYVTLDLDVLDPSFLPGTGTPEPGGATFSELLKALTLLADLNVVGTDLMELAPLLDPSGASTAVACKLLREWLLLLSRPERA